MAFHISLADAAFLLMLCSAAPLAGASPAVAAPAGARPASQRAETGPKWSELTPAQRSSLTPLEHSWSGIDADRKQKWLGIAAHMPRMAAPERERVQMRMTQWASLSPQQRGQVRMGFQEAKQVEPHNRQSKWEAYQALSAEQKQQLATRALPPATLAKTSALSRSEHPERGGAQPKSNLVPNPAFAARPRPVGPTVVQARPGATTTLISRRAAPPAHQQTGLPKIAATPEFVDRTTLLPQRGAQGAATHWSAASAPVQRP